jgi:hypothetical protein
LPNIKIFIATLIASPQISRLSIYKEFEMFQYLVLAPRMLSRLFAPMAVALLSGNLPFDMPQACWSKYH